MANKDRIYLNTHKKIMPKIDDTIILYGRVYKVYEKFFGRGSGCLICDMHSVEQEFGREETCAKIKCEWKHRKDKKNIFLKQYKEGV